MTKLTGMALALALAGCASAGPRNWENTGQSPFAQTRARCQIETQEVDEAQWEICMNGFGWYHTPGVVHDGGYDVLRMYLNLTPNPETQTIGGWQYMTLRAEHELTEVRLDANALTLAEATMDGTGWCRGSKVILSFSRFPIPSGRVAL